MSLFDQIAAVANPVNLFLNQTGVFSYSNSRHRVYEFTILQDAIKFCKMFGGKFAFSVAAPIDRYIIIVE